MASSCSQAARILELKYEAMHFRIGGTVGGVLFSAGHAGGDVDFAKVFELCSAPMLVVNVKSRMIIAANKAAYKAYHLTPDIIDAKPITESLLHASNFTSLLGAAKQGQRCTPVRPGQHPERPDQKETLQVQPDRRRQI